MFYSGLLTILFTLASKQGTLKRTFGGDDEDDDDDDEDDDDELADLAAAQPRHRPGHDHVRLHHRHRTLDRLRRPISHYLLGDADPSLVIYAALAGGTAALYRVSSIAIWIERRPKAYVAVEVAEAALHPRRRRPAADRRRGDHRRDRRSGDRDRAGAAVIAGRPPRQLELCWDWREAIAIYKKGAIRVPLVLSMWVVGYADIFILSRFVYHAELGTYHLASRAAFLVAILPGGYRKALRPLQKTPMFRAVEDEYGVGNARGIQFGYFTFVLAATMLMTTVMATVMVRVAPPSYADAAPLIPLVAGGLVAPTVYRMINKSVKYADKRAPFIIGAVVAMLAFVGLTLLLIPTRSGSRRTPVAMMIAFALPTIFVFFKSQRGRSPIILPWRPMFITAGSRSSSGQPHSLIDPGGIDRSTSIAGIGAILLWLVLCGLLGAVPAPTAARSWGWSGDCAGPRPRIRARRRPRGAEPARAQVAAPGGRPRAARGGGREVPALNMRRNGGGNGSRAIPTRSSSRSCAGRRRRAARRASPTATPRRDDRVRDAKIGGLPVRPGTARDPRPDGQEADQRRRRRAVRPAHARGTCSRRCGVPSSPPGTAATAAESAPGSLPARLIMI